jgi:uncharacterized protein
MKKIVLLCLMVFLMLPGLSYDKKLNLLDVSAQETIYSEPDIAYVILGVIKTTKQITSTQKEINNILAKFKDSIQKFVDEKDIKTTNFSIREKQEWDSVLKKRKFVGYEIKHLLKIKVNNVSNTGKLIDNAVLNGLNHFGSVQFDTSKREKLKEEALKLAIKKARVKASVMAEAAGVSLKKIHHINENGSILLPPSRSNVREITMQSASTEIETGQLAITSTVRMKYIID